MGLASCTPSRVSRLEAAYADATRTEVEVFAKVLGVDATWLETGKVGEPPQDLAIAASQDTATDAAAKSPPVDIALIDRSRYRSDYEHRQFLTLVLSRSREQLPLPNLPPAEWRHWRSIEKLALDALRMTPA